MYLTGIISELSRVLGIMYGNWHHDLSCEMIIYEMVCRVLTAPTKACNSNLVCQFNQYFFMNFIDLTDLL